MKAAVCLILAASLTLAARSGLGANIPYFPYETIEKYYQPQTAPPPEPPAPQPQVRPGDQPTRRPGKPVAIKHPPDFLFPPELKFGVAVGVPYDLMYLSGTYYYWQGGVWYRASTYRGPWEALITAQVPPELRKRSLVQIRKQRDLEYQKAWKEKEQYQGKRFRPGGTVKEPEQ